MFKNKVDTHLRGADTYMKHFWALDKPMALLSAHGPLPWVAILLNVAKMCTESIKGHLYNLLFFFQKCP